MYKNKIVISLLTSLMFVGSTYANDKEIKASSAEDYLGQKSFASFN
jgi:hypothetical protein